MMLRGVSEFRGRWAVILAILAGGWLAAASDAVRVAADASAEASASQPPPAPSHRAVLDRYCGGCHNERLRTGGLTLDGVDVTTPAANPDVWERVIARLRAGSMPPPGLPRPDRSTVDAVATSSRSTST